MKSILSNLVTFLSLHSMYMYTHVVILAGAGIDQLHIS